MRGLDLDPGEPIEASDLGVRGVEILRFLGVVTTSSPFSPGKAGLTAGAIGRTLSAFNTSMFFAIMAARFNARALI